MPGTQTPPLAVSFPGHLPPRGGGRARPWPCPRPTPLLLGRSPPPQAPPGPTTVLTLEPHLLLLSCDDLPHEELSQLRTPAPVVQSLAALGARPLSHRQCSESLDPQFLCPPGRGVPVGAGRGAGSRISPSLSQDARSQCPPRGRRRTGHRWHATDVWCTWGICVRIQTCISSVSGSGQAPAASERGATASVFASVRSSSVCSSSVCSSSPSRLERAGGRGGRCGRALSSGRGRF